MLGDVAGYNKYEAVGRIAALWAWCVDRGLRDAPDDCEGYAVSEPVLRRFLGAEGLRGILADGCDELALGVQRPDGLVYLRGTSEYVAHRRQLLVIASAGGKARAAADRGDDGHFVGKTTNVQPDASREPAVDQRGASGETRADDSRERVSEPTLVQPAASRQPAGHHPTTSDLPLSSSPSSELIPPARARAIPPDGYQPHHPGARRLADEIWNYAAVRHAELRARGIDANAPPWTAMPNPASKGWQRLVKLVDGELHFQDAEAVRQKFFRQVDVVAAEAERKHRSLQYFVAVRMWSDESFEIASNVSVESVHARAGPKASTQETPRHVPRLEPVRKS